MVKTVTGTSGAPVLLAHVMMKPMATTKVAKYAENAMSAAPNHHGAAFGDLVDSAAQLVRLQSQRPHRGGYQPGQRSRPPQYR